MSEYDNNLQVIWERVYSDNPKAPKMRVTFEVDGTKYRAGLWAWEKKDGSFVTDKQGNKKFKGKAEIDDFVPEQEPPPAQPARAAEEDFTDDDIPF